MPFYVVDGNGDEVGGGGVGGRGFGPQTVMDQDSVSGESGCIPESSPGKVF